MKSIATETTKTTTTAGKATRTRTTKNPFPTIDWLGDAPREHGQDIITAIASYTLRTWRVYPMAVRIMPDGVRAEVHCGEMRDAFGMASLAKQPDKVTGLPWKVVRFTLTAAGRRLLAE